MSDFSFFIIKFECLSTINQFFEKINYTTLQI
jgi:hypothetical protein